MSTRPNAGGEPDTITVSLGLLDISAVEDRRQQFTVDAIVAIRWQDSRLAATSQEAPDIRTFSLGEIWTPSLLVLNNRGLEHPLPDVVTVDRDGNVAFLQRVAGSLAADLELEDFPFDTQVLTIDIVSYQYSPTELKFSADSEIIAKTEQFRSRGWEFKALEPSHSVYRLAEDGPATPMLRFAVEAERRSSYYALTLALPMTLILFLAWLVHWLPPGVVPPRVGMASATVFSVIAFGVSFRLTLPAIDYLTRADRFVVLSTVLVAVSLAITVIASRWATSDRLEAADRLSRRTRLAFPVAYVAILVVTLYT